MSANINKKLQLSKLWYLLPLSLLLTGCVSTHFEQVRESETGLQKGEAIAVLGRQNSLGYEAKESLINCLSASVRNIPVVKEKAFADRLFPWFETRVAPKNIAELKTLLQNPAIADQMIKSKVRYLIWADGASSADERKGSMSCAALPTGALCLGFIIWTQNAKYEITIWDIKKLVVAGRMRANATGTAAILGAIAPVPLITPIERGSCKLIAKRLSTFILDGKS